MRSWICPDCGKYHDRDTNAAINIRNEGMRVVNALV
ncbi:MAG: transposase [Clostridiales bacterium]|nr:transposase [Clostridiales bacterium]MBP5427043.1 transposase [Clostridiales bacterium]